MKVNILDFGAVAVGVVLNTEAIQKAIDEVSNAGGDAISGKTYAQFHDALIDAEKAMKENAIAAINVFKG